MLERAAAPGGKMRQVSVDGVEIDAGPTVFTMRWVFEALFADAGAALGAAVTLHPAEVLARHAWHDGGRLDLFADIDRSCAAIGAFAGASAARGYADFCIRARRAFDVLDAGFMRDADPSMARLLRAAGPRGIASAGRPGAMDQPVARAGAGFPGSSGCASCSRAMRLIAARRHSRPRPRSC